MEPKMSVLLLIIGLVLFIGLVVIHEFGHFITARRAGVDVEEFGLGFPPRARILTKKNGTTYTLNWLPLGGFVRLKGEHDADKTPGSYGAASLKTKVYIMLAGVVMNLLTAFVMLTFLALIGMPKLIENQFTVASDTRTVRQEVLVGYVEPDSPAARAGLQTRDQLLDITQNNQTAKIDSANNLPNITPKFAGQEVQLRIKRHNELMSVPVQLRTQADVEASKKTANPHGYLGISPTEYTVQRSGWSAPVVAAGFIKQVTALTFKGLGSALAGLFSGNTAQASAQVSGPVGIFVLLKEGSLLGYQFVLMIIAIISLTLAIMNVLPIPALDGGRLFVTLLFRLFKRPLKERTEDLIHGTGFLALMVLFVLITVVDVRRFF
ncbi:MAG TPA: site-2 protease family protein [Candidatus Limnocylindrales bacterium]|nr:site-2 protease family protein [Candidatus Limnocylindrales bacterium]